MQGLACLAFDTMRLKAVILEDLRDNLGLSELSMTFRLELPIQSLTFEATGD